MRTPAYRLVKVAEAFGAKGIHIDKAENCGLALQDALNTHGPVIVESEVDPFEPPMSPKVTLDQASKLGKALIKGEPNREKIALTVLHDKIRELI